MELQYNIYLELAAMAFVLVLLIYMHLQYNLQSDNNRAFRRLTLFLLLADAMDVATAVTISYWMVIPVAVNTICNTVYLVIDAILGYQFMDYAGIYVAKGRRNNMLVRVNGFILLAYFCLLAVNLLTGWIFSFSAEEGYIHGPAYLLVYLVPYYFIMCSSYLLMRNFSQFGIKRKIAIIMYIIVGISGPVIQMIFLPDVLFALFTISLELLMMFFSMETPDYQKLTGMMRELEQTKDIAEEARGQAQRANIAKTEFLSSMSHEIRTPINAILGMNEMILREAGEDEIVAYAKEVRHSGKLLLALVDSLMDFAQIDSNNMRILPVKYSIQETINDFYEIYSPQVLKSGLALRCEIDRRMPECLYGDVRRIRQIISVLMRNSLHYTEKGEIILFADFERLGERKILLRFGVRDTGRGMSEETGEFLRRYFNEYGTIDTYNIEESGPGLALLNRLADKMDGRLEFQSVEGVGTEFYVEIPQRVIQE